MTDEAKGETVAKLISAMNEIIEAWRAERAFYEAKISDMANKLEAFARNDVDNG